MRSEPLALPGDNAIKHALQALTGLVVATFFAIIWALFDTSNSLVTQAVHAVFGEGEGTDARSAGDDPAPARRCGRRV